VPAEGRWETTLYGPERPSGRDTPAAAGRS
jgi:hypothetical protein